MRNTRAIRSILLRQSGRASVVLAAAAYLSGCVALVPFIEPDAQARGEIERLEKASCPVEMAKHPQILFFAPEPTARRVPRGSRITLTTGATRAVPRPNVSGAAKLKLLVEQLHSGDPVVRTHAATDLGMMGRSATSAIDDLARAVRHDQSKWVRRAAVKSLGKIGTNAAQAPLRDALRDSNKWVAHSAERALRRLSY